MSGSESTMGDFAFVLTVKECSTTGGTVFNYQDEGTIVSLRIIRDIVIWCNATHVKVDVTSDTGDSLWQIVSSVPDLGGTGWITLGIAYAEIKSVLKLMKSQADLGLTTLSGSGSNPHLGLPGTLRIGGMLNGTSSKAFSGQAMCCVMCGNKIANGDIANAVAECKPDRWPSLYPFAPGIMRPKSNSESDESVSSRDETSATHISNVDLILDQNRK